MGRRAMGRLDRPPSDCGVLDRKSWGPAVGRQRGLEGQIGIEPLRRCGPGDLRARRCRNSFVMPASGLISPNAFLAGVSVLVAACVLIAVVRSQLFALGLLLALFIPSYAMRDQIDLSMTFGGFRITALDALCGFLLLLGFLRMVTGERKTGLDLLLLVFSGLLVLHIARGIIAFGLQPAINSSRPWLYLVSCLIYAATVPRPWDVQAWRVIIVAGLVLATIGLLYVADEGFHSTTRRILVNGELTDSRPVVAAGALLILQAIILMMVLQWPGNSRTFIWVGLACVALILLQHRTVWVCALAVVVVGFVTWSRQRVQQAQSVVMSVTGLALLVVPAAVWALAQSATLRVSAGETTHKQSTFQWRLDSWKELIASHHSVTEVLIGEPAGLSWSRFIFGETTDVAAHSSFVEAFLRFGAIGTAGLIILLVGLYRKRTAVAPQVGLTANAVTLLLLSQGLFAFTYTLAAVQGVILGIFVSSLAWQSQASVERATIGPRPRQYSLVASGS
jgi:hypothetical protein